MHAGGLLVGKCVEKVICCRHARRGSLQTCGLYNLQTNHINRSSLLIQKADRAVFREFMHTGIFANLSNLTNKHV